MISFNSKINQAKKILNNIRGIFEKKDIKNKLQKLTSETTAKNFWKNQNKAKSILREKIFTRF